MRPLTKCTFPTWASMAWAAGVCRSKRVQLNRAQRLPSASVVTPNSWVTMAASPAACQSRGCPLKTCEKSPLATRFAGSAAWTRGFWSIIADAQQMSAARSRDRKVMVLLMTA